jgi:uncharacterized protein involved in exopolysaccharide biosynthesis
MLKQKLVELKLLIQAKLKAALASIKAEYQIFKARLKGLKAKLADLIRN